MVRTAKMKTIFMMITEPGGEGLTLGIRSNVSTMEETVGIHATYIKFGTCPCFGSRGSREAGERWMVGKLRSFRHFFDRLSRKFV